MLQYNYNDPVFEKKHS